MLINEKTASMCQYRTITPKRHNETLTSNLSDKQLKNFIASLCNEEISGKYEFNEHNSPVFQLLYDFLRGIPSGIDQSKNDSSKWLCWNWQKYYNGSFQ